MTTLTEQKVKLHQFPASILTCFDETQNIAHQIKRLGAGQVTLDRKSLMIHQELLKIPGDVVTLDGGPQDRLCVLTDDPAGERTTGLQGIN